MNIEIFVKQFAEQFDATPEDSFKPAMCFKENEEWDSMTALSVIAMVDENYAVRLTGEDIRTSSTIEEVYQIVSAKAGS